MHFNTHISFKAVFVISQYHSFEPLLLPHEEKTQKQTILTSMATLGTREIKKDVRIWCIFKQRPRLKCAVTAARHHPTLINLHAIGERRPVIRQGRVGGTAQINMDYSSMTDTCRRAFRDLPSDLGLVF